MDPLLLTIQLLLSALGIVGVSAATPEYALDHALRCGLGVGLTFLIARISPRTVIRASPQAYTLILALLAAVLFFGVSPEGSDSRRWLLIGGISLQPSELMKVTVIAYLTAFFHNHLGNWQIWRPMVVMGLAAGLIVAEPDVSTALFLFTLAFVIMVAAGTSLTRLLSISMAAALIAVLVAGPYLSQFRYIEERIVGYSDLWGPRQDTSRASYQAVQAEAVLVQAGILGIGPGRRVPVPAAETDMIAVAIGQSMGLVGIATLVVLYMLLAGRGLRIAAARGGPGSLLAAGATAYICGQAALNLLVAAGLFPVTGIPLPFVSYGLNSLLSVAIALGFIHSAYRQTRKEGVEL